MKRLLITSLKTRLYLLILLVAIPGWGLSYYAVEVQKDFQVSALLDNMLVVTRAAALAEAQKVEETRLLLKTLSGFLTMTGDHAVEVHPFFADVFRQTQGYLDLGAVTPGGERIVSAGNRNVALTGKDWFRRTLENRGFTMGDSEIDEIAGEPAVYFGQPVLNADGQLTAVVFAALSLKGMDREISTLADMLPEGAVLNEINASGDLLAYDARSRNWAPSVHPDPALLRIVAARKTGVVEMTGADGTPAVCAFVPLSSPLKGDRFVVLTIPKQVALAASDRLMKHNLLFLGLISVISLIIAGWTSERFVLRRIRSMEKTSRKLAAGDFNARIESIHGKDELSGLARSFNEMAGALQQRDAKLQQVGEELRGSREKLRNLAAYLQDMREQERIRIAREIHDDFGQSLTLLKMDLSWLTRHVSPLPTDISEKLAGMSQVIDDALQTMHAVSAELRPVILDDFGLWAAIEWQLEEFRKRVGMRCRLMPEDPGLDMDKRQATAVFRIFQELLTNIMRHARASRVEVNLDVTPGDLVLTVVDDGCGIAPEAVENPRSFGLIGIRERLYPWNGRVEFIGSPGEGTRVIVRLPIISKESTHD